MVMMKFTPTEATMSAMTRVAMLIPLLPIKRLIGFAAHSVRANRHVVTIDAATSALS